MKFSLTLLILMSLLSCRNEEKPTNKSTEEQVNLMKKHNSIQVDWSSEKMYAIDYQNLIVGKHIGIHAYLKDIFEINSRKYLIIYEESNLSNHIFMGSIKINDDIYLRLNKMLNNNKINRYGTFIVKVTSAIPQLDGFNIYSESTDSPDGPGEDKLSLVDNASVIKIQGELVDFLIDEKHD